MELSVWMLRALQPAEQGEVYSTPSEPQMGLKPLWGQRHCALHCESWAPNPELSTRKELMQLWSIISGHLREQMNRVWAGISENPLGCTTNPSPCAREFLHHPKPLPCLGKAPQPHMGVGATPFPHALS